MTRLTRILAVIALAYAASLGGERTEAAVYWSDQSSISVANLDGSQAQRLYNPVGSLGPPAHAVEVRNSQGIVVAGNGVYWVERFRGTIGRASVDGSGPDASFITGLSSPVGIAADATHLYWADQGTNMLGRARLDGTAVERAFIADGAGPCGVAVDGAHIYWGSLGAGTLGRANLDGTGVEREFVTGAASPCWPVVSPTHVYWAAKVWEENGSIGRAPIGGGAADNAFVPAAGEPRDLAIDADHVYWADHGQRNLVGAGYNPDVDQPGAIARVRLDGSGLEPRLIATGLATGIALDSRVLSPPATSRPSDFLRFVKLTHEKRTGTIRLLLGVPARGSLRVAGPKIGWRVDMGDPPPQVVGSFVWKLKLWPGRRGKAAKRIRRQLRQKGRAPFLLKVVYRQEGRKPLTVSKRLAFQLHVRERTADRHLRRRR